MYFFKVNYHNTKSQKINIKSIIADNLHWFGLMRSFFFGEILKFFKQINLAV